jgi:hypothetical protein
MLSMQILNNLDATPFSLLVGEAVNRYGYVFRPLRQATNKSELESRKTEERPQAPLLMQ